MAGDTNILIYAQRQDSPFHTAALEELNQLGVSKRQWAIPWPCIHEFVSIVTGLLFKQNATLLGNGPIPGQITLRRYKTNFWWEQVFIQLTSC